MFESIKSMANTAGNYSMTAGKYGVGAVAIASGNALKVAAIAISAFMVFGVTTAVATGTYGLNVVCPLTANHTTCAKENFEKRRVIDRLIPFTLAFSMAAPTVYQLGEYLRGKGGELLTGNANS